MTLLSIFSEPKRASYRVWTVCSLLLVAVVLGGCDAISSHSDDGTDPSESSTLLQLDAESFEQADLQFSPVALSPGDRFSIELVDEQLGQPVTRITHQGTPGGGQLLKVRFDPLKPTSVAVRCRNQHTDTQTVMSTLDGDQLASSNGMVDIGEVVPKAASYHYIEGEENTIVEIDYDLKAPGQGPDVAPKATVQPVSSSKGARCTHIGFVLKGVSTDLSADGVRFSGDATAPRLRKKAFQ
jgi:hypothetical protein